MKDATRYFKISALWALVLFPGSASAETTWDVLQRIGRTGTWAANCWFGPSWRNHWVTLFRDTDSIVRQKIDRGADGPSLTSVVDSAQILTPSTLQIRFRHDDPNYGASNGFFLDIVEAIENDRDERSNPRVATVKTISKMASWSHPVSQAFGYLNARTEVCDTADKQM